MDQNAQILFEYLRDVLYNPDHAELDVDKLGADFQTLGKGLIYMSSSLNELRRFARALSKGDLSIDQLPTGNELAAPLKAMHANLRHLTWQSQQVAKGDYSQHVDFMGDFSEAFNTMTRLLERRERALEEEIRISHEKTKALQSNNELLTEMALNIPQLIFVLGEDDEEILFANKSVQYVFEKESSFLEILKEHNERAFEKGNSDEEFDFGCSVGEAMRYYTAHRYRIYWNNKNATAYTLTDISQEQMRRKELEEYAFHDPMTKLYNRLYGLRVLSEWLETNKHFVLCFADLDNLKYINDHIGHTEGDEYIIHAADAMSRFSDTAVCCRIGGDEFLILIPDIEEEQAAARMEEIRLSIKEQLKSEGKSYYSNISYGMVEVMPGSIQSAGEIMGIADERMYKNKWGNKRRRLEGQPDDEIV